MSLCVSVASHISETSEAIAIKVDTVTASVTRMHHVLIIILSLTFIQGHTDLNHENDSQMLDYCRICSSNAHQVGCEDSPTKGVL